jgi:poly(3-hydroxybutyrate) depolymerase
MPMRTTRGFLQLAVVGIALAAATQAQTHDSVDQEVLEKAVVRAGGASHSYALFVPTHDKDAPPMPLLVAVHGAGGSGLDQIQAWLPVARANKFILLAPNIDNSPQAWDTFYDHPEWIHDAIDSVAQSYPVDKHRIYIWGYSAGGMFTFYFAFMESRYFAAAAVHGGVIEDSKYQMADFAVRKIPVAYYIGTRDQWWTTKQTRASRDALLSRHFEVHYVELVGADHNFFARSAEITADAWEFFKQKRLDNDPVFDPLDLKKIKESLR